VRINKKLNMVIPVERDEGKVYVHSVPISSEVFERYHLVIAQTFSAFHLHALGPIGAPRTAALILKDIAKNKGAWEGEDGIEFGLMGEIRRLTNVAVAGARGWEPVPLEEAVRLGVLDDQDKSEVENAIVYFTVSSAMYRRGELAVTLDTLCKLWDAQTTSLNITEYAASLPTSIETGSFGERVTPSSIPS
jgi:hypothetical protein